MQPKAGRRPEFSPTFESNFEQVGIQAFSTLDSNHAVGKTSAPAIFPWAVEIAGRIACGPNALRTMLAPWQNRASKHPPFPLLESRNNIRRYPLGRFYLSIRFSLVHCGSTFLHRRP